MKKKLRIVAIVLGTPLVLLIVALLTFPGAMVKSTVNTAGPALLGVDVKLDQATFRLLRGNMKLGGLFIGNPEGFNTKSLCRVGSISIDLEPSSLRTDTIIINEVYIDKPVFTYQKSLLESNLSKLLKSLEGDGNKSKKAKNKNKKAKAKKAKAKKEGGRKVIIRKLTINDPMVKLSIKGIPAGAPIPLPDIVMIDIGKKKGGATPVDVITRIFRSVLSLTMKVAVSPVKLLGKGGSAALGLFTGSDAKDAESPTDTAKDAESPTDTAKEK